MSEDSENFTFFAPVKLSPEERDSSIDTCLSDKLGDYDSLARILTSDSPEREELAGINSGSSSSTRPAVFFRGNRNPTTSTSAGLVCGFGNEGASHTHHKSSSSRELPSCAPNPKKLWKDQFTGGDPSDVIIPQSSSSSNHKSDRFSSPLSQISEASADSGIFCHSDRELPGGRSNSSSKGHSNSIHSRSHNTKGNGKKSNPAGELNVEGRDNKVGGNQVHSKPSTAVSQFTNNQRSNHRQSNTSTTSHSSNPISSHHHYSSSSTSASAFVSSSNERDYVTDDVIEPAINGESSENSAQLITSSSYNNSTFGSNGNGSALACASSQLSSCITNSSELLLNSAQPHQHLMSTATTTGSAAGGGAAGVKSVTSSGSGRGVSVVSSSSSSSSSSSRHSSSSSHSPHSHSGGPSRHPPSSSNFASRSGDLNHIFSSGGSFKAPSFNRKHKLNQPPSSSSSTPDGRHTSQTSSRGDREGSGGVPGIGQGTTASVEQTNELYQTHYHSNGAMSNESKRIKLESVNNTVATDWVENQSKDTHALDAESTTSSADSNFSGRSFQPIRASTNSANNNRTSSPLLGSNKSRSPARSLLLPKDAISDRTSSPVDFTSSPNKRKTPSYNNQYHKNHHSKQENSKQQNCSSATLSNAASPCHLEPQSGDRELSLANNHHAGDQNASKQTAFSNSPNFSSTSSAPLSWKGSSHGGRRSPLKGNDKSKQSSGPPMARVAPMTRSKPQTSPVENIPGSHRSIEDANNADAMRALHQLRNNLATDPRVLRAEQILKEIESLKTPDPILFPIGGSLSSGSEPNNNHKPFDFESIFLPNSDPIALLDKEMPDQVLNLPKVCDRNESIYHVPENDNGKMNERRVNQPPQFGHESAVLASDRRLKQEFVDVPSGAAVSVYSEGLLDDRGATGRGGRERDHHPSRATAADKHGQGDKDRHRSRDGNPPSGGSRDKLNHHHSSPPHSSISSISTSATLVATANPHASVVHHSSRDDINNKAFQSAIPGGNGVQCSVDKESNSRSSNSYNNMRNIDEFRNNLNSSKPTNVQRVLVKQHRPHKNFNGNQTPSIEDFERLQFQDESSNSDPLPGRDCPENGERCGVKVEDDHHNLAKEDSDSIRRAKKNEENNEEHTNCNDDLSSSSSSSSSEDEDSGSDDEEDDDDDDGDDDDRDVKTPKQENGAKEESMEASETDVQKNQESNVEKGSNAPASSTAVTSVGSSNTTVNNSSSLSRPSWSLASFGVAKLSTSPSPVKNQSKHATGSTRNRSGNSRGANSDRSASGPRSSNSSSKQSSSSNSKSQANPPVNQPQPPTERQSDDLGKLSDSSVSPPIKVVATRKEHTAAIAAKNKDKIASVHPFSKTSTKKSAPETSGGHVSSLTPLISPNKVNKQQTKISAFSNSIPSIASKVATQNEETSSSGSSKKQKKPKKRTNSTSTSVAEEEHLKKEQHNESGQDMYDDSSGKKNSKDKKHKRKEVHETDATTSVKNEGDFSALKLTHFESYGSSGSRVPTLNFVLNVAKLVPPAPDVDDGAVIQEDAEEFVEGTPLTVTPPETAPSKKRKRADHDKGANKKAKKQSKQEASKNGSSNSKKHDSSKQATNEDLHSTLISPSSSNCLRPSKTSEREASLSSSNHERGNALSRDVSPVGMKNTSISSQPSPSIQRKVSQKSIAGKEVHGTRNAVSGGGIESLGVSSQGAVSMDTALMSTMTNGASATATMGSPFCSVNQDHDTLSNSNFSGSEMASDDLNPILGHVGFNGVSACSLSHGAAGGGISAGSGIPMNSNQFFLPSTSTSNVVASGALSTASSAASSNSTPATAASGTRQNNDSSGLKTFYSEQARMFKRKADNGSKLESCLDYAQAVIYYISYAVACLNSNDSLRAFKIFTSKEIKSIINVAMKLNVKHQNATINQDRIDIITVLLMKIRGYTEIQAYNVRKEQSVRYVGTLADFIRDRNEHANTSNGRMDPESPTQSVASYGSNGSGTHLQRDTVGLGGGASSVSSDSSSSAGGGGVNSSSAINMPADMYSIFESYIDASQHLIAAHDTWDQAVLLLKRPNVAKFYCTVDQECGYTVNIQSQPEPFINYCNAVISLIRPKMANNSASPGSLPPLTGTAQATTASANNQQSNVLVTANHNSNVALAS